MTSILKVSTIQNTAGVAPTAGDLGLDVTGSVLQVVDIVDNNQTVVGSSNTWVTYLSGSIIPTSTSSKILILVSAASYVGNNNAIALRLLRGGTGIVLRGRQGYENQNVVTTASWDVNYVDSPNSTTSVSYEVQAAKGGGSVEIGSGDSWMGTDLNRKTMTLIEIAG
jgi:hypothetical protein